MNTGPRLLLVPTDLERQRLPTTEVKRWLDGGNRIETCGFGQIVASARTMQLLSTETFDSVVLVGIAGTLCADISVGSAIRFGTVYCDGIGVGQGSGHQSAMELGWHQWSHEPTIDDEIHLSGKDQNLPQLGLSPPGLVSVAAASATRAEAQWRKSRFPLGIAEDMEGFGVAVACRFANVPLAIVRGISNVAGDRNHARWKIAASLEEAMRMIVLEFLPPQHEPA